jgi:menaquinol-cytochrome c reductase iron-sulfur subunit
VQPESNRRGFLVGAIYSIWAVIGAALSLPALGYLFLPPKLKKKSDWIKVGDISKLDANSPVEMAFRRNRVDGWKVLSEKGTAWVVKQPDGKIVAFGPQCTHLGCAYHWEEKKEQFLCPCHASLFAIDGDVTAGPALRSLDRYETRLEGNSLLVGALRQMPEKHV